MKLTKDNAKEILTYKKDPQDERDYKFSSSLDYNIDEKIYKLPATISYRDNMTPVKDQGGLGSCVGFAVTAMKEWQETVEHKTEVAKGKDDHREGKIYDLSESWVYWMSKKIDPWPNEEGTSIRFAMKVLNKLGTPSEEGWEYDDRIKGKPKSWAHLIARWARIDSYWRINNLNELKMALLNGPVVIGIPCFEEIFKVTNRGFRKGFIEYPSDRNTIYGGHAICVTGYNNEHPNFGPVVEFKNSWSGNWGDRGYGYLPYTYIVDFLWDAWACSDVSMTKEMLKENRSLFDL